MSDLGLLIAWGAGVILGFTAREAISWWRDWFHDTGVMVRSRLGHKPPPPNLVRTPDPVLVTDDESATIGRWVDFNPWYAENGLLRMEAQRVHTAISMMSPELSLDENLALVEAEMRRRHPEIAMTRQ
jgi:hypothetical protein